MPAADRSEPLETSPTSGELDALSRWAIDYVSSTDLQRKIRPVAPPRAENPAESSAPVPRETLRVSQPGRPPELDVVTRSPKSKGRGAMVKPLERARLLHTFWHHELQAAELFCWAVLAFPETPDEFRMGLVRLWADEVRHMRLYQRRIEALGSSLGDFPVRDWFWSRVPTAQTPVEFLALMGLGLEAANLDHADRFAEWLDEAGDPLSAAVQRRVGRDEVEHVRFSRTWFERLGGRSVSFDAWSEALADPLTPVMFVGPTVARAARKEAGLDDQFVDALVRARADHLARSRDR